MVKQKPRTIRDLRDSGYKPQGVKQEMRRNLIGRIEAGQEHFPGIIGYEESVVPHLENAILSGQDVIFLGERGQAKSRLIRSLVNLLDDEIPSVTGCEINDSPFDPICKRCRDLIDNEGDDAEIEWVDRDRRYGEKLATPDITIADLIGEVDPIKVAEGRYLSDELTLHYGLIPRHHRGIFCINELPDLAERIQVGLLNIMEERDVQIRGYRIRLPLDVLVVASANPEDYTNRGRIITPLKDRYGAQIRTHYPKNPESEIEIMEQERTHFEDDGDRRVDVPQYMKEIVAEITRLARRSPDINQRSGVSVRASIADYEALLANAMRRAIRLEGEGGRAAGERPAVRAAGAHGQDRVRDRRRRPRGADRRAADPGGGAGGVQPLLLAGRAGADGGAVQGRLRRGGVGHDALGGLREAREGHGGAGRGGGEADRRQGERPADGVGGGVRAGGAAPQQAAEQGQGLGALPVPGVGAGGWLLVVVSG